MGASGGRGGVYPEALIRTLLEGKSGVHWLLLKNKNSSYPGLFIHRLQIAYVYTDSATELWKVEITCPRSLSKSVAGQGQAF